MFSSYHGTTTGADVEECDDTAIDTEEKRVPTREEHPGEVVPARGECILAAEQDGGENRIQPCFACAKPSPHWMPGISSL